MRSIDAHMGRDRRGAIRHWVPARPWTWRPASIHVHGEGEACENEIFAATISCPPAPTNGNPQARAKRKTPVGFAFVRRCMSDPLSRLIPTPLLFDDAGDVKADGKARDKIRTCGDDATSASVQRGGPSWLSAPLLLGSGAQWGHVS